MTFQHFSAEFEHLRVLDDPICFGGFFVLPMRGMSKKASTHGRQFHEVFNV